MLINLLKIKDGKNIDDKDGDIPRDRNGSFESKIVKKNKQL